MDIAAESESLVKSIGESVNIGVNSVQEKRSEVHNMVVDSVENFTGLDKIKPLDAAINSSEENKLILDSVENLSDSLKENELVNSSNMVVNSFLVEKDVGSNDVVVDSRVSDEEKVGEKRRMTENNVGEVLGVKKKKARVNVGGDMKRVAEIVLVLSALGSMRGGRNPTDVEKEIMDEAKEKLVGLCERMAPKVIVPKDAVRVVIEDLGINRSRDQRLGFRPSMMTIKEKLQLSKRKMEESKKFAPQSGIYSTQMSQAGFMMKKENSGAFLHGTQRFPDRPSQITVLAGGFGTTSSTNQVMQSATVSRGPVNSPLERVSSLPHTETVHFRLDGRSNLSTYASQAQANSCGDHLLGKAATCAPQLQTEAVARVGFANKVPDYKVEGTPVIGVSQVAPAEAKSQSSNQSVTQTVYRNPQAVQQPLQGLSTVHNEIAKSVQMFLYAKLPEHPCWTPPSTDYMNKSLTCQVCKGPICDVESVLVCDACEKGNHTGCLRAKGVPKSEWHCPHCLQQSNGKPLPPKYGRVTKNNGAALDAPASVAAVQASAEKVESSDQNANHQKASANGHLVSLHPTEIGRAANIHVAAADIKTSGARGVQGAYSLRNKVKMDDVPVSEHKSVLKDMAASVCTPFLGEPNENIDQKSQSPNSLRKCGPAEMALDSLPEAGIDTCHGSTQPSCISRDVGKPLRPMFDQVSSEKYPNIQIPNSRVPSNIRKDGQEAAQNVSVGNIAMGNGARDCLKSSVDGLHSVDWVGDILQVADEKAFYSSCCINGMTYKLQDHALFCSNNGDMRPSKLQALWEDTKTGSKWAIVNSCYFPADLPEVVGRPCSPENNEVYESNHGSTVRAGLVQGPCEVLPPNKFKEESERRIHSDDRTQPIFLCKWFYDESKGLFRPVTD